MSRFFHLTATLCTLLTIAACNKSESINPEPGEPADGSLTIEVIDYEPAPGQFVNELPLYEQWMTKADVIAAANTEITQGRLITLGAWGGSVTIRLHTPIAGIDKSTRLKVLGNAITGGAEPGLVYVMEDANGNDKPDDEWLLIAPANLDKAVNVTVTYYRPDNTSTDGHYIRWTSTDGTTGYLTRNSAYHSQPYFPQWITEDEITFTGLRLPDNGYFDATKGMYVLDPIGGTADSYPNRSNEAYLSLDNLVDSDGRQATIRQIDFVKIVTGVLQSNGPIGECSTEVAGITTQ